jgi:uncharacterized protein DUF3558
MAAVLGVAMLTAVSACDNATAGQPQPTETTKQSASETSKSQEQKYSMARLCDLLSPEEAQQLGGSAAGEEGNALSNGTKVCTWKDKTGLTVGFQENTTTAQANTGPDITNTPTTVDGLTAVLAKSTDTIVVCQMLVDLPNGWMYAGSVSVRSAGEGQYDPCQVATQLANLVVPRVKDQ